MVLVDGRVEMFLASLDTGKFTFHALGTTPEEAKVALTTGLEAHARQHNAAVPSDPIELTWWLNYDDAIRVSPAELGACYRDASDKPLSRL